MTLVSDAEMAALRAVAESGMVATVSIYHLVTTAGEGGRTAAYPATPDATLQGWITELTAAGVQARVNAGEVGSLETHRLLVAAGSDIRNGDKITQGTSVFIVQATTAENTYQPYLAAYMRLFE